MRLDYGATLLSVSNFFEENIAYSIISFHDGSLNVQFNSLPAFTYLQQFIQADQHIGF